MLTDGILAIKWWAGIWILGLLAKPIVNFLFPTWKGKWLLAKPIGLLIVSYLVWLMAITSIAPFGLGLIIISMIILASLSGWVMFKHKNSDAYRESWKEILVEELLFLFCLLFWSWIKAHEPTINGLEKFMDFGFTQSILNGGYFPPKDMWFSGQPINYYYFGHLTMAVLVKLTGVSLSFGFNLMLATLFSVTFTTSFVMGRKILSKLSPKTALIGAIFIAWLVTLSGNLHSVYAFTRGYTVDSPPPFWQIWSNLFNKEEFLDGWNTYWYPNATRFIPYSIHEFPSYSFVVSDIHGHVLAIPIALILLALNILLWEETDKKRVEIIQIVYGFLSGLAFMTNALDGPIYIGLWMFFKFINNWSGFENIKKVIVLVGKQILPILITFLITVIPFMVTFKPFVSGVAINCPPALLENRKIGPLLFEGVEKCQKSELWMLVVLWGFFAYAAIGLASFVKKGDKTRKLLLIISVFSALLIVFPEFFYFKDIYPLHFRSNTMFKLGYQAFILMSFVSGYTLVSLVVQKNHKLLTRVFLIFAFPLLILVSIYPYFSVRSYFGSLKEYKGLYGLSWLEEKYPEDFQVINWLNANVDKKNHPVILEAPGDSYTDYNRISTFTGLPTVVGWAVHEWLWRGGYEPVGKRSADVTEIYTGVDPIKKQELLKKYKVKYVVVGWAERGKYLNLNETTLSSLGRLRFEYGSTKLYEVATD